MFSSVIIAGQRAGGCRNGGSKRAGPRLFFGLLLAPLTARSSDPALELRGVLAIGNEWHAAITGAGAGVQRWSRPGDRLGGFTIESIGTDGVTLIGADGARRLLPLPDARMHDRQAPPAEPAAWVHWVISRDNPMRDKPADSPVELTRWRSLPSEQRGAICTWYQDHGWELRVQTGPGGVPEFDFAPLQRDVRQTVVAEKQRAFLRALAPEQRTLHTALLRAPAARQRFIDSLTPSQRAAFEQLRDPSVPLPPEITRRRPAN